MTVVARPPIARDFMQPHVFTVTPDTPLAEVIQSLLKHKTSNAPVIQEQNGRKILVGFVSERDCLAALSREAFYGARLAGQETAQTLMRAHPVCVAPETDLFALTSTFVNHGFRHLPVVDHEELVGIVSRRDILAAMDKYYNQCLKAEHDDRFPPDLHELRNLRFIMKGR